MAEITVDEIRQHIKDKFGSFAALERHCRDQFVGSMRSIPTQFIICPDSSPTSLRWTEGTSQLCEHIQDCLNIWKQDVVYLKICKFPKWTNGKPVFREILLYERISKRKSVAQTADF